MTERLTQESRQFAGVGVGSPLPARGGTELSSSLPQTTRPFSAETQTPRHSVATDTKLTLALKSAWIQAMTHDLLLAV